MVKTTATVTVTVAAAMVTMEARAMATVVTLLVASDGGDGGNGTTTDVCHQPLTEAILTGWLPTLIMACSARVGVSDIGWERATTLVAAVVVAAGRGGAEAPVGGNNV
jgi:hypothetical protein